VPGSWLEVFGLGCGGSECCSACQTSQTPRLTTRQDARGPTMSAELAKCSPIRAFTAPTEGMPTKANYSAFDLPARLFGGPPGDAACEPSARTGLLSSEGAKPVESSPPTAYAAAPADAGTPSKLRRGSGVSIRGFDESNKKLIESVDKYALEEKTWKEKGEKLHVERGIVATKLKVELEKCKKNDEPMTNDFSNDCRARLRYLKDKMDTQDRKREKAHENFLKAKEAARTNGKAAALFPSDSTWGKGILKRRTSREEALQIPSSALSSVVRQLPSSPARTPSSPENRPPSSPENRLPPFPGSRLLPPPENRLPASPERVRRTSSGGAVPSSPQNCPPAYPASRLPTSALESVGRTSFSERVARTPSSPQNQLLAPPENRLPASSSESVGMTSAASTLEVPRTLQRLEKIIAAP